MAEAADTPKKLSFEDKEFIRAASDGDTETLNELFYQISSINMQHPKTGMTPLHAAVLSGVLATVQWLLNRKVNPNIQDNEGDTPLHYAAREFQIMNVIAMLTSEQPIDEQGNISTHESFQLPELRNGVSVIIENKKGFTAFKLLTREYQQRREHIRDDLQMVYEMSYRLMSKHLIQNLVDAGIAPVGKDIGNIVIERDGSYLIMNSAKEAEDYCKKHYDGDL